jgi:CheY-like chemotaxis protein
VNVGRLLKDIDDLLRRALGETVEIETVIGGGLWNTFADPAQVENVILNLAVNARDAMGGAGKLTIETSNAMLDDRYAARYDDVEPGQYVMLAISDTGCGMAPEVLERVFEPFFTTKPEGRGTGLGLSMVYGFVKQSKGHIKLYSEAGQGTTVKIYLPRALQAEEALPAPATGPIERGTETVLVAEDDPEVRQTVVDMLTDLGYRVLKAGDAQSALVILQSGVPVDLLFTDVVMPGPLRTPELARQAKQAQPDLAVLFTSGYTENAIVHGGRLDPGVELLSKPYSREQLARKLRHILRNREQRMALEKRMAQRRQAVEAAPPQRQVSGAGPLRVLLVEDDEHIRVPTLEMLQELGHKVTAVDSAERALDDIAKGDFDLLFTDVSLPGIGGVELAQTLVRQHPRLRVIIASGYGTGIAGELESFKPMLLPKPYGVPELVAALERISAVDVRAPLRVAVDE